MINLKQLYTAAATSLWLGMAVAAPIEGTASQGTASIPYQNPLPVNLADPYVLLDDGTYYLYGTQSPHRGFRVYQSTDLVTWTGGEFCFVKGDHGWGKTDFWAPEVYRKGATFYMFFTAKNPEAGIRNICIATASSPLGPFIEKKAPLLPHGSFIDSHLYEDEKSGTIYCYATVEDRTPNELVCGTLKPSLLEWETSPTAVLGVSQKWENRWVEGPYIVQHGQHYYLMYSGNAYWEPGYGVGYATATSPMGPWEKSPDNPILRMNDQVHGPGHHGVTIAPDGKTPVMLYHRHRAPGDRHRVLAMDLLQFEATTSGPAKLLAPAAPSVTTQTIPLGPTQTAP